MDEASSRGPGGFFGFNGNTIRAGIALALMRRLGVDAFVETGSSGGATAFLVAAETRLPVRSCDTAPEAVRIASRNLRPFGRRVRVVEADARDFLRDVAADVSLRRPFFYLDAHSLDDIPLVRELSIILAHWPEFIVLVDDFQVPGDAGFRYYAWGEEVQGLEAVAETLGASPAPLGVFFPAYPSILETGLRSGWALIVPEAMAEAVEGLVPRTLLLRASLRS